MSAEQRNVGSTPINVRCTCGHELRLPLQFAGKQGKCPLCGTAIKIPLSTLHSTHPTKHPVFYEPESTTGSNRTLITSLCIVAAGIFLAGIVSVFVYSNKSKQVEIAKANAQVTQVIKEAEDWLIGKSNKSGEEIEVQITSALQNELINDKSSIEESLSKVRLHRAKLVEQKKLQAIKLATEKMFQDAISELANNNNSNFSQAQNLLAQYIASSTATQKLAAQQLLRA